MHKRREHMSVGAPSQGTAVALSARSRGERDGWTVTRSIYSIVLNHALTSVQWGWMLCNFIPLFLVVSTR